MAGNWNGTVISLLTPLHQNHDFTSGLRTGLADWYHRGIKVVGDLVQSRALLTFQQTKAYLGSLIMTFKTFLKVKKLSDGFSTSPLEYLLVENKQLKFTIKLRILRKLRLNDKQIWVV